MASSKTLEQAIADITIWRKGEQRAPHKPLLLLYVLANYQQGHVRLFDYGTEVHEQLLSLLEHFGPQRKAYYPNIPFWRLKRDGFWDLQNTEFCSTTGSKQPPVKELVEHNVAGGFDEEHFALLSKNKNLIGSLRSKSLKRTFLKAFRKSSRMRWFLISSRSVRFETSCSASRCCELITMSVQSAGLTCDMITPLLDLKPRISSGSSLVDRVKSRVDWPCVQFIIRSLKRDRLGWMRVCGYSYLRR